MKIVAMMPIKTNNERLPGKNEKLLGGKPLLRHMLDTLVTMEELDRICVYCSQESIQALLPERVEFVRRSEELDLPAANFTQIFEQFRREVEADVYVYAHATAPLLTAKSIRRCIDAVVSGQYDSAFTASKLQDFLWQEGKPLNFDPANIPRSQDLPPIYRESSGVYVFTAQVFDQYRRRVGMRPFIQQVTGREAVDINEPEDFTLAQALLNLGESVERQHD